MAAAVAEKETEKTEKRGAGLWRRDRQVAGWKRKEVGLTLG